MTNVLPTMEKETNMLLVFMPHMKNKIYKDLKKYLNKCQVRGKFTEATIPVKPGNYQMLVTEQGLTSNTKPPFQASKVSKAGTTVFEGHLLASMVT